jgi:protein ImuB
MARWACVDVPELPLQLLLQREPGWAECPVAVVTEDAPQARLVLVNEKARASALLPGMRYAAALALAADLRAGIVDRAAIAAGVTRLTERLRDFSPAVEPKADQPGVFWLSGDGLSRLFPSASAWARAQRAAVAALGFTARVVVGFTRYGAYAVAMSAPEDDVLVFRTPEQEQTRARSVPLTRLALDPAERDDLIKLGIQTLGDFLDLPGSDLATRFGDALGGLHRLASGETWAPLRPDLPAARFSTSCELGFADTDRSRLLFAIKALLDPLLARLAAVQAVACELRLTLKLATHELREESVRPAQPTGHSALLLDLVRLRLESTQLAAGVEEVALELLPAPAIAQQQTLWAEPQRDFDAANRALARLRAELGPEAVVRARLLDRHLPEAAFLWEPLETLGAAGSPAPLSGGGKPTLVRRILTRPIALPQHAPHLRDDGWLIRGPSHGAVAKLSGPFVVSGGWWSKAAHREYHFAATTSGEILWVFLDRERGRWFLQGQVE